MYFNLLERLLDCQGCHPQLPQAEWFKQQKCVFLTALETWSPRSWRGQGWFLLRPVCGSQVDTRPSVSVVRTVVLD